METHLSSVDNQIKKVSLTEKLDDKFFRCFLPLVHSENAYPKRFLDDNPDGLRLWTGSNDKVVIGLPPPALVKEDPKAKPERLGRVVKRLAACYRQPLSGKIRMAHQVLKTLFKATDKVAVAFSGGKDSLVALHLALQIKPDIPVMFVNTGIEFPESLEYTRQLATDWKLDFHEANAKVNFWRLTEEQGLPVAGRGNTTFMSDLSEKSGVKLSNSCCHRMKETPARQFYREHKTEGVVTGLRVSESLMRKMNFADYGALRYSSTYKTLISWPLYAWLDEDITKYIDRYELPWNPIYEMGYKRVGCWACLQDMFYKDSRLFTLEKEHPNMYKTVQKKFGKQMSNLLKVWAGLEDRNFTEEQLLRMYKCDFDILNDCHKEKKKKDKLKQEQSA